MHRKYKHEKGAFFGMLALGVLAMGFLAFLLPGAVMTARAEAPHVHCMCGKTTSCGAGHNASQVWQPFDPTADDTAQLPVEPGYYYLTDDVELKSDYTAEDGVFLCLNGHTVNTGDCQYSCDGTLTITNCKDSGGFERINYDHSALYWCYMINARHLNLYNTRITLKNLSYGATMLGFRGKSGDKSKYHIEGCTITYENDYESSWGGGEMYAVYLDYAQSLTIKDTTITGSSYSEAYGVIAYNLQDSLSISNTQIDISTTTSSAAAMTVYSEDGTAEQVINGSAFKVSNLTDKDGKGNSAKAVSVGGNRTYSFKDCTIEAVPAANRGGRGLTAGSGTLNLDNCQISITSETGNDIYGIETENGILNITNGSTVSAVSGGNVNNVYGVYYKYSFYSDYEERHGSFKVHDSQITGTNHGIYVNDQYGNVKVDIDLKNSVISGTNGYGVTFTNATYGRNSSVYLGGSTKLTGGSGGMSIYRYTPNSYDDSPSNCWPKIYAYSLDETGIAVADGEQIGLDCVGYAKNFVTGDIVIWGGMTNALVGKIVLIRPDTCTLEGDGTAKKKVMYSLRHSSVTGGSWYYYDDPQCEHYLLTAFEGKEVYLKAEPDTHYTFKKWEVEEGNVTIKEPNSAVTSFIMGTEAVTVKPVFEEAANYTIAFSGGSQSDGSVNDFTSKKYQGEALELPVKVFKNKNTDISQTGWALSDGGEKAYDLGGTYELEGDKTLYPFWQSNYKVYLKYGNFPAEGKSTGELAGTLKKIPGQNLYLNDDDIEPMYGYKNGGTAARPYTYYEDSDGNLYKLNGLSKDPDGFTLFHDFDTYYEDDADITLYPYWTRFYRVHFAPGTYGVEREEPLEDLFKDAGDSVTLYGKTESDGKKTQYYESMREGYVQGGWSVKEDGSSLDYAEGASYSGDANIVLYPYWEKLNKITYLPGDLGYSPDGRESVVREKYAGVTLNISYALFMRNGYTQTGWNTKEDGTGDQYAFNGKYSLNEDLTLYPEWNRNNIITYMPDAAAAGADPVKQIKYYGTKAVIKGDIFEAQGYVLKGWTTVKGGTEPQYEAGNYYEGEEDLILYPVRSAETFALWIGDTQVTYANKDNILGDGTVSFDPDRSVLSMNGLNLASFISQDLGESSIIEAGIYAESDSYENLNPDGPEGEGMGIHAVGKASEKADHGLDQLTIALTGKNVINPGFSANENLKYGIYLDGLSLECTGEGTLDIGKADTPDKLDIGFNCSAFRQRTGTLNLYAGHFGIYSNAFFGNTTGTLIEGGELNIVVTSSEAAGIFSLSYGSEALRIKGGKLSIVTTGDSAVKGSGDEAQTVMPAGIVAESEGTDAVVFSGGEVTVINKGNAGFCVESDTGFMPEETETASVYAVKFLAGDISLTGATAAVGSRSMMPLPTDPVYVGEGVTVKAGNDKDSAIVVSDYPEKYTEYKYASFSGGNVKEDAYLHLGNTVITDENLTGTGYKYVPATSTLTLTDLDLDSVCEDQNEKCGIYSDHDLNLVLAGASSIGYGAAKPETAIRVYGDLTVSGTGHLDISADEDGISAYNVILNGASVEIVAADFGVSADDSLYMTDGVLKANATGDSSTGVYARGSVIVNGGIFTVRGVDYGVRLWNDFTVNDGEVSVSADGGGNPENDGYIYGVYADTMNIRGGKVNVSSYSRGVYCDDYVQSGGDVSLISTVADDTAYYNGRALIPGSITVSGGSLYTEAQHRCIVQMNSYATMTINGGLVRAVPRTDRIFLKNGEAIQTPTVSFGNTVVNGGRLEVTGHNYCIIGASSPGSEYPSVKVYGGSVLLDDSEAALPGYNKLAVNGSISVLIPSSRYRTEKTGFYTVRTVIPPNGYKVNCIESNIGYFEVSALETVSYRPDSLGTGEPKDVARDAGVPYTLEKALYRRTDGYVQDGWSLTEGGDKDYALGGKYSDETDVTFYPHWAVGVNLTYKPGANSKETDEYTELVAKDSPFELKGVTYTRDGFVQIGWAEEDNASVPAYGLEEEIAISSAKILYPVFTDKITLTYDKGSSGKGDNVTQEAKISMEVILKDAIFTRNGFRQVGWTLTDGGEKDYDLSQKTSFTKDTTLYPAWEHIHTLKHYESKEPTTTSEGNIEYWQCTICLRYFLDAEGKQEAVWADIVIPKKDEPGPVIGTEYHKVNVVSGASARSSGSIARSAKAGQSINIFWTSRTGYEFVRWNISGLNGAKPLDPASDDTSFTMGESDVIVSYVERLKSDISSQVIEGTEAPAGVDTKVKVGSLKFAKNKLILKRDGEAANFPAVAQAAKGAALPQIYYVTDNMEIVAVDQSGNFYPMGIGEATVTAYCGSKKAACKVTVSAPTENISILNADNEEVSETEDVIIVGNAASEGAGDMLDANGGSAQTIEMKAGEQTFVSVLFTPYDSTDPRAVTWKSDNKNVQVKNGVITAKEVKEVTNAVITASVKVTDPATWKVKKEPVTKTVNVRVVPVNIPKASSADKTHTLALKKKSLKMVTTAGGNTAELLINVTSKDKKLSMKGGDFNITSVASTNPGVVAVGVTGDLIPDPKDKSDKKGTAAVNLTAKSPGTAYIIVVSKSSNSGEKENLQVCKVTVTSPVSSVAINSGTFTVKESGTEKSITVQKGESGVVEIVTDPYFSTDMGKLKLTGSGGITVKNGVIYATKVTKTGKPAKLTVKCGKKTETVNVKVVLPMGKSLEPMN